MQVSLSLRSAHEYFKTPVHESAHQLSDLAQEIAEQDPELSPGLNCCAVCCAVKQKKELLYCQACQRVVYCCKAHRKRDDNHKMVCQLLTLIEAADAIEVEQEREKELVDMMAISCKGKSEQLQSWSSIIPKEFTSVWCKKGKSKSSVNDSLGASTSSSILTSKDNSIMKNVVELAVGASLLSYPMTLRHLLTKGGPERGTSTAICPAVQQVIEKRHLTSVSPLVICVLGASDTAELVQLRAWKVLEGVCTGGLSLQFIGPEVPSERHGTVVQVATGLQASFWKGEYHHLVNCIMPLSDKPSSSLPLPEALRQLPDMFVGFNMGLTCPDYSWDSTLQAIKRVGKKKQQCLALTVTSNTFLEASLEDDVLTEAGWMKDLAVCANPWVSLELMQSGTLGNDVYRKNAWMAAYYLRPGGTGGEKKHGKALKQGEQKKKKLKPLPDY